MRILTMTSVVVMTASMAAAAMAVEVESGLKVGEFAGAFNVKDCTGPNAGVSLCYRWAYGGRPVVNVFTRSLTDNLASLVKKIDKAVAEHQDQQMSSFLVLLTEDPDAAEAELKAFAKKYGIKHIPLTYFDGAAGPPNYKIAKDAEVTVHLWRQTKVEANHAFGKGELNEAGVAQIVKDTDKILN